MLPPEVLQRQPDKREARCWVCHRHPPVPNRRACMRCLAAKQEDYWQHVKDGICTRCKRAPAQEGHRRCEACAEKVRQDSAARYRRTKRRGICTYCRHHEAMPHRELCFPCFKKYGSLKSARHQRKKEQWMSWILVVALWTCGLQIEKQARRSA